MKRYGVPFYFYVHVEVDEENEEAAKDLAETLRVQVSAKLDGKMLDVYFEEIGEAVEV